MISATQIQELIENDGYPAMFESYDREAPLYPQICQVVDASSTGAPLYGQKGAVFKGVDRFEELEDGNDPEDSTLGKDYTWQAKIRTYSRRIRIPRRVLAANRLGEVKASLVEAADEWGELSRLQKDDFVAGMFQRGTLTAAQPAFFDNTYINNTDPNAGFIYDGLPWFDTAHQINGSSYANHVASGSALTEANLETHLETMTTTNAVDARGNRVIIRPTHLIVPGGLNFTAQKILRSVQLPGSANNDINPLQGALIPVKWSALTDAASSAAYWIIEAQKGLKAYDSGAPVLEQYRHMNGDVSIIATYNFGATVSDWRRHFCANKAAS
jgi:hypothetical protein